MVCLPSSIGSSTHFTSPCSSAHFTCPAMATEVLMHTCHLPARMASQGDSMSSHQYHEFHNTAASLSPRNPPGEDHRLVRQFHGPGVERQMNHREDQGFIYGSTQFYLREGDRRGRGLSEKMSVERVKLRKQQLIADTDYQEGKARAWQEKAAQKRRDLDMLRNYQPWGKPAAGAPRLTPSGNVDTHRRKMDHSGGNTGLFGRPGGGAPLRTHSGRVAASLKADPETRFQQQTRKEVERILRYRVGGGEEKERGEPGVLPRTESEKQRKVEGREKQLKYAKRLEEQRVAAMERKAAENEKTVPEYYPWGRGGPQRDESGKILGRRWLLGRDSSSISDDGGGLAFQLGRPGGGAPLRDRAGQLKTRRYNIDNTTGQFQYPLGRFGGEAPLVQVDGHMMTNLHGKYQRKKIGGRENVLEIIRDSQQEKTREDRRKVKGYGMDVASWLSAGVVGQPRRDPVSGQILGSNRTSSDITTNFLDIRHPGPEVSQYFTDLQAQAEQRQRQLQEQREVERRAEREHMERAGQMWGPRKPAGKI